MERTLDFLKQVSHRPYELPRAPYVMSQAWRNLLFAHWRIEAEILQSLIPAPLEVDTFDGSAWLGVVPFRMCDIRGRFIPFHIDFLELNVRTYVKYKQRRGVYFFSLDADHSPSVWGARTFYDLPYHRAKMSYENKDGVITYKSTRLSKGMSADFEAEYQPIGPPLESMLDSLPFFLTERYCLMVSHGGLVHRTDIHHAPWGLAPVKAIIKTNTMATPLGISLEREPDSLLYSEEMRMVNWLPTRER